MCLQVKGLCSLQQGLKWVITRRSPLINSCFQLLVSVVKLRSVQFTGFADSQPSSVSPGSASHRPRLLSHRLKHR